MSTTETPEPEAFAFTAENAEKARAIIARYPPGRQQSAVLPLLDLAQRQHDGWLPRAAMEHVAGMLGMPPIRVYEVATFYTMFNKTPVGRHHVQVCTNISCWLRGSDAVLEAMRERLGLAPGETDGEGHFTLSEVECLGACCNAPMMQVDDDYYEDLDPDSARAVIDALDRGEQPTAGSRTGRQGSAPEGGRTTLTDRGGA